MTLIIAKKSVVENTQNLITIGTISSAFGVKGWVKVISHTQPIDNIINYRHWIIYRNDKIENIEIDHGQRHGKSIIVHIVGCNTREFAKNYCNSEIMIDADDMPPTDDNEVYWHQLEGLKVFTINQNQDDILLGNISHMMATGANDVLTVRPSQGSIDKRERLIPWLINQVVREVNIDKGFIRINWDPEF